METDTFTHIDDEEPINAWRTGTAQNVTAIPVYLYPTVYIADECIERIADAVVRKLREMEHE